MSEEAGNSMKANWEKVICAHMDRLDIPGQDNPLYKPRGDGSSVWILTSHGDLPSPPPPLDRHAMAPCGGRELDVDVSDPDFLLVHKVVGMSEYTHCIPWDKVSDIIFYTAPA